MTKNIQIPKLPSARIDVYHIYAIHIASNSVSAFRVIFGEERKARMVANHLIGSFRGKDMEVKCIYMGVGREVL